MVLRKAKQKERNLYIDILKVMAIVLIVITHDPWSVEHKKLLIFPMLIDMAVPIFMIVSGYNYANGMHNSLKDEYKAAGIWKRLKRILVPFLLVFAGMVMLLIFIKNKEYTVVSLLSDLIKGGYGPGAYYTPIMVQFILLSPLLWYVYSKYSIYAVFAVNLLFETGYTFLQVNGNAYQFLIFRYLFLITLGFEMRKRESESVGNKIPLIIMFIVGIMYLVCTSYVYNPVVFTRWTTTSMISGFYIWPILLVGQVFFNGKKVSIKVKNILEICSNATFHIYLVQMVYYYIGIQRVFGTIPAGVRSILSVLVCMAGGVTFYYIMKKIQNIGVIKSV